jgi:predicted ribosomally synthesized peptide with SipW-like signal peptide
VEGGLNINQIAKAVLFVIVAITLVSFSGTYAYFTDTGHVETTITVGVWDAQADYLAADAPQIRSADGSQDMIDISLKNIGAEEIVIDSIQIGWNITESDSSNVMDIMICGEPFYSGSVSHGEIIDGVDVTLGPEESPCQTMLLFGTPVSGPIDICFIMADGSRKCILM